jgi:hypothetical protein
LIEKVVKDGPNVDPKVRDPANWPAELLAELGNDDARDTPECGRARQLRYLCHQQAREP